MPPHSFINRHHTFTHIAAAGMQLSAAGRPPYAGRPGCNAVQADSRLLTPRLRCCCVYCSHPLETTCLQAGGLMCIEHLMLRAN